MDGWGHGDGGGYGTGHLVSNPVVGAAVMGDTTQELVPNQGKDQRKMMQAQAKQMIANQVNQGVANRVKQVPKC